MSFNIIQSLNSKVTRQGIRPTHHNHKLSTQAKIRTKSLDAFVKLLSQPKYFVTEQDENIECYYPKSRMLNSQKMLTEFGYIARKSPISKSVRRNQKNINELQFKQRRLSCCCSNCGQFGRKVRKFHDVLIIKYEEKKAQASPKNVRSLKGLFTQVAKTTRTCISLKTIPKEEKELEFSPKQLTFDQQCKAISRKTVTQALPAIKKPIVQDYLRKMNNLNNLIEHTQLNSVPSSNLIRNSAPNLDAFDKPIKDSPMSKREQSVHSNRQKQNIYLVKHSMNGINLSKFREFKIKQ